MTAQSTKNIFTGEIVSGRTLAAWGREIRDREAALSSDQLALCSREVRGEISKREASAAWDALRVEAIDLDNERERFGAANSAEFRKR